MSHAKDVVKAEALSAGSALVHRFPTLEFPWRKFNDMERQSDVLLRWRRDKWHRLSDAGFVTLPGKGEGTASYTMRGWSLGIIAVNHQQFIDEVVSDPRRVPAVGYKAGDDVTMVGVYEQTPHRDLGHFMNRIQGNSAMLGIVVGIGEHPNVIAIGSADNHGESFIPLPTESVPATHRMIAQHYRV